MTILRKGENCCSISRATSGWFLIDGQAYFRDLYFQMQRARTSIFIVGWDVDSRIHLVEEDEANGYPCQLGAFLNRLVERNPQLTIYILMWDYIVFYAFDREPFPTISFNLKNHERILFKLDDYHPIWASHHQKIVVIDDRIAYCGGLDMTSGRWDTSEHLPNDVRRRRPNNEFYGPFHDLQIRVEGDVARELGKIARQRWRRAGGKADLPMEPFDHIEEDPFQDRRDRPDFVGGLLGVSLTQPEHMGAAEIRQIERMYLDLIGRARRAIYIENQYFASQIIAEAFKQSLRKPTGPEIVVVLPSCSEGWLETRTMGVLKNRVINELREADRYGRLGMFMPQIPGLPEGLKIHSKLIVVDDCYAMIGSSNINNRSMGLDTECNLIIDGEEDPGVRWAISWLEARLLAEHLDTTPANVFEYLRSSSRLALIAEHSGDGRCLKPFVPSRNNPIRRALTDLAVIDMTRAFGAEREFNGVIGSIKRTSLKLYAWYYMMLGGILGLVFLVSTLLEASALGGRLADFPGLGLLNGIPGDLYTPPLLLVIYLTASLFFVPINFLILGTATVLNLYEAVFYSFCGAMFYAVAGYGVGAMLGIDGVQRMFVGKISYIAKKLEGPGLLPIFYTRVLLWLPFWLVNFVAGAARINILRYLVGTGFGLLPGIIGLTVLQYNFLEFVERPRWGHGFSFVGISVFVVLWIAWCRRRLRTYM